MYFIIPKTIVDTDSPTSGRIFSWAEYVSQCSLEISACAQRYNPTILSRNNVSNFQVVALKGEGLVFYLLSSPMPLAGMWPWLGAILGHMNEAVPLYSRGLGLAPNNGQFHLNCWCERDKFPFGTSYSSWMDTLILTSSSGQSERKGMEVSSLS